MSNIPPSPITMLIALYDRPASWWRRNLNMGRISGTRIRTHWYVPHEEQERLLAAREMRRIDPDAACDLCGKKVALGPALFRYASQDARHTRRFDVCAPCAEGFADTLPIGR